MSSALKKPWGNTGETPTGKPEETQVARISAEMPITRGFLKIRER